MTGGAWLTTNCMGSEVRAFAPSELTTSRATWARANPAGAVTVAATSSGVALVIGCGDCGAMRPVAAQAPPVAPVQSKNSSR